VQQLAAVGQINPVRNLADETLTLPGSRGPRRENPAPLKAAASGREHPEFMRRQQHRKMVRRQHENPAGQRACRGCNQVEHAASADHYQIAWYYRMRRLAAFEDAPSLFRKDKRKPLTSRAPSFPRLKLYEI
jgi:hypothetical protein